MTQIDVNSISIAQIGIPSGIEPDLHKVVESIVAIVLSFGPTAIAAQLCDECLRPHVIDSHGTFQAKVSR